MAYTPEVPDIFIHALTSPVPYRDGWLVQPPLALPMVAADWQHQSRGSIENGRYVKALGAVVGKAAVVPQDTYYIGASGSFTGLGFNLGGAGTGQWKMYRDADLYDNWGILLPSNELSTERTLTQSTTTSRINDYQICVRRWWPTGASLTASNWYTKVRLAYGSQRDFQIVANWNEPIKLQVTEDGGSTWKTVMQAKNLGSTEQYLVQNDQLLRISVLPDHKNKILCVEIGDGHFLTWAGLERDGYDIGDDSGTSLSEFGRVRLEIASGSTTFEVFPVQWGAPTIRVDNLSGADLEIADTSSAFLVCNSLSPHKDNGVSASVSTDGDKTSLSITVDPAGVDGIPRLTDGTLVIPSLWTFGVPGGTEPATEYRLSSMQVVETQVWDDLRRISYANGTLVCNNSTGQYTGAYRRRALNLYASIDGGGTLLPRLTGVCGVGDGLTTIVHEGARRLLVPFSDNSVKMMRPLGMELMLDGWELGCAVRFLLERGNIDWTRFTTATSIPTLYVPPGATSYAPYGQAGDDLPDGAIQLGSGVGDNPRYRFGPEMTPWDVLQILVADTSDVFGNPYQMGFDIYGIFHFEPWIPENLSVVMGFASDPKTSVLNTLLPGRPILKMNRSAEVNNSTEQMRTEMTFQGMDAKTFELLTGHRQQPPSVCEDLGWRQPWYERNGRWSSEAYLSTLLDGGQIQSALPAQTVNWTSTYYPALTAGMLVAVDDIQVIGATPRLYIVMRMQSSYGMSDIMGDSGVQLGEMALTGRWLMNLTGGM